MKKGSVLLLLAFLLVSCAPYKRIVDLKNVDHDKYTQDLKECEAYAEEVDVIAENAQVAGFGALLGAAVAAISGGHAGIGGLLGAATAVGAESKTVLEGKKKVVNECLKGRGYKVLR